MQRANAPLRVDEHDQAEGRPSRWRVRRRAGARRPTCARRTITQGALAVRHGRDRRQRDEGGRRRDVQVPARRTRCAAARRRSSAPTASPAARWRPTGGRASRSRSRTPIRRTTSTTRTRRTRRPARERHPVPRRDPPQGHRGALGLVRQGRGRAADGAQAARMRCARAACSRRCWSWPSPRRRRARTRRSCAPRRPTAPSLRGAPRTVGCASPSRSISGPARCGCSTPPAHELDTPRADARRRRPRRPR